MALGRLLLDARHPGRSRPDLHRRGRSARRWCERTGRRDQLRAAGSAASDGDSSVDRQDRPHRSPAVHDCRASRRAASSASRPGSRRTSPSRSRPFRTAGRSRRTSSSWLHLMGRLRDGLSHQQANVALQAHLAGGARGHDRRRRAARPAGQRTWPGRQTSSNRLGRILTRPAAVRRAAPDSLRARRAALRRRVRQRRQPAPRARHRPPARDRRAPGDRCQPRARRPAALHRIARVDVDCCRDRGAAGDVGRQRPGRA